MSLPKDHKVLYSKVRLKSLIFLLSSLALIFGRIPPKSSPELALQLLLFNLAFWAIIFLVASLGIAIGTRLKWKHYIVCKSFLALGLAVGTMWEIALIATSFTEPRSPSVFFLLVMILQAYFLYHLFRVIFDPDWQVIELEKS